MLLSVFTRFGFSSFRAAVGAVSVLAIVGATTGANAKAPPRRVAVLWLLSNDVDAKARTAIATSVRDTMRWEIKDNIEMRRLIGVGKRASVGRFLNGPDRCPPPAPGCARQAARALNATHFVTGTLRQNGRSIELLLEVDATNRAAGDKSAPLRFTGRAPSLKFLREEAVLVARRALKKMATLPVPASRAEPTTPQRVRERPHKRESARVLPKRSRVLHYDTPQTSGDLFVDGDFLVYKTDPESPFHENHRVPLWRIKKVVHAYMIGAVGLTIVDDDSMFAELYYFASAGERDDFEIKLNRLMTKSKKARAHR